MSERYDVTVVGGGPAGSSAAALLARSGYHVALLDRAHFPRPKPCGEYMSPGVEDVLRRCGLEGAVSDARPRLVSGMEILSPGGASVRIEYTDGGVPRHARTLLRSLFDSCLVAHAGEQGVDILEGFVVKKPLVESGVVVGVQGTHDGRQRAVQSRLTIVADGSRSILARRLGLASMPRWPVRTALVAHYAGAANMPHGFGQMHVGRRGYCGIAPLPNGLINVGVVVPSDRVRDDGRSATEYYLEWIRSHRRVREALAGCERVTPVRGRSPVGARANRAWIPGALLTGDAAGFFDPFTGEGIYQALRGAEMVREVADLALRANDVTGRTLAQYGHKRVRAFLPKRGVTALVQIFVQYPGLLEYALPRLARRPDPRSTLSLVLGDIADARGFLAPRMLWASLRP